MNGSTHTSIERLYPRSLTKLLSREEERELLVRVKRGDRTAASRLVYANVRFVMRTARPYWMSYGGDFEDYVHEGILGLMRAIEKFDTSRSVRLISYAVNWIRVSISNYVMRTYSVVKIGTTQRERQLFFSLSRYRRELAKGGVEPDDETLAEYLRVDVVWLRNFEVRLSCDTSLDAPVGGEDEDTPRVEMLAGDVASPETEAWQAERIDTLHNAVHEALCALDPRERNIIESRYLRDDKKILKILGDEYDVSRERIRQLELRAKEKLRDELHSIKDLLVG